MTLLNGWWGARRRGIQVFGSLWLVTAVGLAVSVVGRFYDSDWWLPVPAACVLLSLILTGLDWSVAWVGVAMNIVMLLVLLTRCSEPL